jgi:serine/threonine protein kinase
MDDPGLLNNRYQLLEQLGKGGMAVVYRARDQMLERTVAVKVLREDYSRDSAFQERFRHEAQAAANLSHPNIVTVHDFGLDDGQLFIVMEYIDGATLRHKVPFSRIDDAVTAAIQIGEALQAAHAKGIVHRDIKSENIMMTSDGRIKVTDFGLAKLKGSLRLTKESSTVGTLAFMAP